MRRRSGIRQLPGAFWGITGPAGTYVRIGTVGSGSVNNFKENKIFEAQKFIDDFMFKLGLSGSKSHEVRLLVEKITDAEYGQGNWFPVFVGACAYVVMRKDHKMLPIVEVADLVGCDVYELGRMITRVVEFIDFKLPEFDIVNSFERSIKRCPSFGEVSEDVVKKMLQQGIFLMHCLIKWFVTMGRKPMPVVAAVLVFVGELNQVNVKMEDIAQELHVALVTCRRRYKELLERLVQVARVLPWGKDVTVKNILKNAPCISPECLSMIYSNFLDEVSLVKAEICVENIRKRRKTFDLQVCTNWWKGKSDLSKKLFLKQILEEDVGLDVMPPSFDKACLAKEKRREKIKAAKLRIQRIMRPEIANSSYSNDLCLFEPEKCEKKRKQVKVDIDWEDLIIETLLLHNVKEEEIEKGHYNEKQPFERIEVTREQALEIFSDNQFKALSAYWRGNIDRESLQRVYDISYPDQKRLKEYKSMLEEAKKYDHRELTKKQELFFFHPLR
ncbi:hypothetical protein DH2020_042043 [Rehmannia glutinosa]|uniref:Uncharacterized protein n=1 Tax=Rehmannia glutinosa TaxID=99300 RepID=A0ABR0UPE0_REHGL